MNSLVEIIICLIAWAVTIAKFRAIHWENALKRDQVVLNIWLTSLFFAITLTFLVEPAANAFDALTFPNLSRLIAYCSVITALYSSTIATFYSVIKPAADRPPRWPGILRALLVLAVFILIVIYALFISKIPQWVNHHIPQSLPEAAFMSTLFIYAFLLCFILTKANLDYLPFEKSMLMRSRIIAVVVLGTVTGIYLIAKLILVAAYFFPVLGSQILISLSEVLLILSALLWAGALLSNRAYINFDLVIKSIQHWNTFRDIKYLTDRLEYLFEELVLPISKPPVWKFFANPEYYLYSAIILIMDSKTMLADFLYEAEINGDPPLWEGDMYLEAIKVNQVLQSLTPSNDFWEIVAAYRRASKELIASRREQFKAEVAQ
jgi:hypothetical protein